MRTRSASDASVIIRSEIKTKVSESMAKNSETKKSAKRGYKCQVKDCTYYGIVGSSRFSSDPDIGRKWAKALYLSKYNLNWRVCHAHFIDSDFNRGPTWTKLKPIAVPSVKIPVSKVLYNG